MVSVRGTRDKAKGYSECLLNEALTYIKDSTDGQVKTFSLNWL